VIVERDTNKEANQIWQKQGESTAFAKYGSSHGALHAPFLSQQELRSTAAQPPASPWPQENSKNSRPRRGGLSKKEQKQRMGSGYSAHGRR